MRGRGGGLAGAGYREVYTNQPTRLGDDYRRPGRNAPAKGPLMNRTPPSALAVVLLAAPAGAVVPHPGDGDPRIHVVAYDPARWSSCTACWATSSPSSSTRQERIENVAIGDSLGWQVTPNRKANLLFLKPMAAPAGHQHDAW